jgi:hypothetical protein
MKAFLRRMYDAIREKGVMQESKGEPAGQAKASSG